MEVFAGLGLVATEVFRYNRQNFAFDQDQRFNRDEMRLKMQVERFRLFRQDIRDMVELTVQKMDLYHMVGALFIRMISIYYSEGFFAQPPPIFLQVAYYLSQACALVYLLMAIWLSMHASIKSHSYATRLLTRFVRLPIPGCDQMDLLNARYSDFEGQGPQMLRVPFWQRGANAWKERAAPLGKAELPPEAVATSPAARLSAASVHAAGAGGVGGAGGPDDELGDGEFAYGGEHQLLGREQELLEAVEFRTRRHVELFRHLQARWQCFDAYARVCMSLGVRHMLQSINYYLLGLCMVQYDALHVSLVITMVFQALAVNITILDIHGLPCLGTFDLSFIGFLPAIVACMSLALAARDAENRLEEHNLYPISVAIYPLEIAWFELLHWVASPSSNRASVPRHFRAVLFMDVFSEAEDPTEAALQAGVSVADSVALMEKVELTFESLQRALACMRRWEEVPGDWLYPGQKSDLDRFGDYLRLETDSFNSLLRDIDFDIEVDARSWDQLEEVERSQEHCAGTVLGPFEFWKDDRCQTHFWDIERSTDEFRFVQKPPGPQSVLTLDETIRSVKEFKAHMEECHRMCGHPQHEAKEVEGKDITPRAAAVNGAFTSKEEKELYKPVRLPWRAVSCLTRTVQILWLGVGVTAAMRESGMSRVDFQVSYIVEERRLRAEDDLAFEELAMQWPYGSFFRVEALHCANSTNGTSPLVSTRFASYALNTGALLEVPKGDAEFCGHGLGCLSASELTLPRLSGAGSVRSGALHECDALEQ